MAPARERLQPLDLAGLEFDLGLEERLELARLQADADFGEREAGPLGRLDGRRAGDG